MLFLTQQCNVYMSYLVNLVFYMWNPSDDPTFQWQSDLPMTVWPCYDGLTFSFVALTKDVDLSISNLLEGHNSQSGSIASRSQLTTKQHTQHAPVKSTQRLQQQQQPVCLGKWRIILQPASVLCLVFLTKLPACNGLYCPRRDIGIKNSKAAAG